MKKLLLILQCVPLLFSCWGKDFEAVQKSYKKKGKVPEKNFPPLPPNLNFLNLENELTVDTSINSIKVEKIDVSDLKPKMIEIKKRLGSDFKKDYLQKMITGEQLDNIIESINSSNPNWSKNLKKEEIVEDSLPDIRRENDGTVEKKIIIE